MFPWVRSYLCLSPGGAALLIFPTHLAVLSETFVRALDDDLASQTTFNLLSFSFLLHVHSQPPLTEASSFPLQLYIHLLLVLLELFTLHLSYTFSPPLPSLRLAITGIYSLVGQGFVVKGMYLTWIHRGYVTELSQRALFANAGNNWEGTVLMNRLPEMCFEVVIVLTIALRLIAAVLRREEVSLLCIDLFHEQSLTCRRIDHNRKHLRSLFSLPSPG